MFKIQPITENESKELQLDSYVTYLHSNHCANCGMIESYSECYEVWLHPTKTRSTNLRDMRRPQPGALKPLPMAVLGAEAKRVPVCHSCAPTYNVAGVPVTRPTNEAWQETLRRKYAPAPVEVKVAKPATPAPKMVPTLDQI